ncbi:hypothetical protein [Saccharothrix variisporea]|uniref:Uncharacterized protein n=1 Tax=Saccharothrix variisporea TaxID=543527 RepID=A0A495XLU3_9PSEU|nr:hypothetical protein [Saccharothrix variisporea]RKT74862.1 hypothetical protein DFJ66_8236 [Saccharothrix variisporea]
MTEPQPPRWVVWVARAVAVVVVVPVTFVRAWVEVLVLRPVAAALRWVWESGAAVARFLRRWVLVPLGRGAAWVARLLWRWGLVPLGRGVEWVARLVHRAVLRPLGWVLLQVGRGLWWVARQVGRFLMWIDAPVTAAVEWFFRWTGRIIAFVARGLWDAVVRVVVPLWRWLVVAPVRFAYRRLLTPVGHALRWVFRWAVKIVGVVGRVLWDAVVWAVERVALPLWRWLVVRPARFVYRKVLTPVGHAVRAGARWVRRTVVEPVRQAVSTFYNGLRAVVGPPRRQPNRAGSTDGDRPGG